MPCRHGTPYPHEVTWAGEPPSCQLCAYEAQLAQLAAENEDIRKKYAELRIKYDEQAQVSPLKVDGAVTGMELAIRAIHSEYPHWQAAKACIRAIQRRIDHYKAQEKKKDAGG